MTPNDPFDDDEPLDSTSKLILAAMALIALCLLILGYAAFSQH